jgi:2-keto-4-pentenoate hydratase/2-oxohepta-3-ene-1,7-dioic acid hydratase in catechol pathway
MLTVKLATLDCQGTNRVAVAVSGERLLVPSLANDFLVSAAGLPLSLKQLLAEAGALDRLKAIVAQVEAADSQLLDALSRAGALVPAANARFRAPIPDPLHFMGCGLAYRQHLAEMGGVPTPANPVLFLCSPAAISAHRDEIVLPSHQAEMVDYEGELAIVIGRPCYNVDPSQAMDYVAGYMAHNDISARDHTAEVAAVTVPVKMLGAWSRNVGGKQHPGFSPMGPFLVTRDEIPDPHTLHLTVRVNGQLVQDVTTDDLIFSIAHYVSYVSQWYALSPGDIISTGSPAGVGVAKKPPVFLQDGDVVTVDISGIGTLSNTVVSHSGGTSGRFE